MSPQVHEFLVASLGGVVQQQMVSLVCVSKFSLLALPCFAQWPAVFYSASQFVLCSGSTLGCLRAWQFPLHSLVSDTAGPHCVQCPLPRRLVGQS